MFIFPIDELLDEQRCYDLLLLGLHPAGLRCPRGHGLPVGQSPHDRKRAPVVDYRCRTCGAVFNAFTGTALSATRYRCSKWVMILRGFIQGVSTLHLAQELEIDRSNLLSRRHELQALVFQRFSPCGLKDEPVVETDELYQNAGEKGVPHLDPEDPPRRRANKVRGHGTWNNDRPPILGLVGRTCGRVCLSVAHNSDRKTLEPFVVTRTSDDSTVDTDDWSAYSRLRATGRTHVTVNHSQHEWARDDDGDGVREVHTNTIEGLWTGVRNFLRPFRGVNKVWIHTYLAMFQFAHNFRRLTSQFFQALLVPFTPEAT